MSAELAILAALAAQEELTAIRASDERTQVARRLAREVAEHAEGMTSADARALRSALRTIEAALSWGA